MDNPSKIMEERERNPVDQLSDVGNNRDNLDMTLLPDAIIHIFLPKETPQEHSFKLENTENLLLQMFHLSISEALSETLISSLDPVKVMMETWTRIQPKSDNSQQIKTLREEISQIQEGCTLPMYVRCQNSTILLTRKSKGQTDNGDGHLIMSTFRSSLPTAVVTTSIGSPALEFPETVEKIKNRELLESPIFCQLLHELSVGGFSMMRRIKKGDQEYTETRDVKSCRLVTEWLVGLLVPEDAGEENKLKIRKKMRDQVTLKACSESAKCVPFRRSGMYMSLKVTLQLKLLELLRSKPEAVFVYKILMLRFLADVCQSFLAKEETYGAYFDIDLGSQMMAKLGTRVKKLEDGYLSNLSLEMEELRYNCLEHVESIVEKFSKVLRKAWNVISFPKMTQRRRQRASKNRNYSNDLKHEIGPLDAFISNLPKLQTNTASRSKNSQESFTLKRYTKLDDFINGEKRKLVVPTEELALKMWLFDAEVFIKDTCSLDDVNVADLFRMLLVYIKHAQKIYQENPLGSSQMLLVALRTVQLVHKKVTEDHPLLLQYKTEVNCTKFNNLLLPFQKDMELLQEIEDHFFEHDEQAELPEILENAIDDNSFSIRYCGQDETMEWTRHAILREGENNASSKLDEVRRIRKECRGIQREINRNPECKCEYETVQRKNALGKWITETTDTKISICDKCKLTDELNEKRGSVKIYEKPFPANESFQKAVAFELRIPEDLAVWRDLLAYFKYDILEERIFGGDMDNTSIKWLDYQELFRYQNNDVYKRFLTLGSISFPVTRTYHTRTQRKDVFINKAGEFVVDNCMTCHFQYKNRHSPITKSIQDMCTFKISSTSKPSSYTGLQKYVGSTEHTQNEVIANQFNCKVNLSLKEFVAFGGLRAGHRIQWRNLFEGIYSGGLSLDKEPVLALILQTVWQVGPAKANERESHLDICEDNFATEFLEMLDNLVQQNSENYSYPVVLINAVMLIQRISELNRNLEDKCYQVLQKSRVILITWIEKITKQINELIGTSSGQGEIKCLEKLRFEIVTCCLLTFNVRDRSGIKRVIRNEDDKLQWFRTIFYRGQFIKDNVQTSKFFSILVESVLLLPLRLNLESEDIYQTTLEEFFNERWGKVGGCLAKLGQITDKLLISMKFDEQIENSKLGHVINFNIFTGEFLIDGLSQSTLPQNITGSRIYKRYFKFATNMRVQQDTNKCYTTLDKFRGKHYEFFEGSSKDLKVLIIKEVQDDSSKLILIDPEIVRLSTNISKHFISNYTHWLDLKNKKISFRRTANDGFGNNTQIIDFELQGQEGYWILNDCHNNNYYFSIKSPGFREITHSLKYLDSEEFINVFMNFEGDVVTANLWRYNLKFTVKKNGCHESIEYPGYSLVKNQGIRGTLIGLEQGIMLGNKWQQIFLVPHAKIEMERAENSGHHKTILSLDKLRSPPLFKYEMDTVLKRVTAQNSKSAWLYLAALHAATSSPLPDKFTEMTGTEAAVDILQSARVWSSSPYDKESLETLNFIKNLSPDRRYYGLNTGAEIETILWSAHISSMGAYDGYSIIVDKLIEDSYRLSALYPDSPKPEEVTSENSSELERLRVRGYLRHLPAYNSAAALDTRKFFSTSQLSLLTEQSFEVPVRPLETSEMSCFLELCICRHKGSTWSLKIALADFLLTSEPLQPPLPEISLTEKNKYLDLYNMEFRSNWLKLYEMAISIKTNQDHHLFTIILSSFAYREADNLLEIFILHTISQLTKDKYETFPSSKFVNYVLSNPSDNSFDANVIQNILERNRNPFPMKTPQQPHNFRRLPAETQAKYNTALEEYNKWKERYEQESLQHFMDLTDLIESQWPTGRVGDDVKEKMGKENRLKTAEAMSEINKRLEGWWRNYRVKELVEEVLRKLEFWYGVREEMEKAGDDDEKAGEKEESSDDNEAETSDEKEETENDEENSEESSAEPEHKKVFGRKYMYLLSASTSSATIESLTRKETWKLNDFVCPHIRKEQEIKLQVLCKLGSYEMKGNDRNVVQQHHLKMKQMTDELLQTCVVRSSGRIMQMTGIIPRDSPLNLLKQFLQNNKSSKSHKMVRKYTLGLCILWGQLKRLIKCLSGQTGIIFSQIYCERERWQEKVQNSDWILLELELAILIRPVQLTVAQQMIQMPGSKNGVTQLDMGQGKTSVIVPMLCATLAQKDSQLCRVTVLNSMFQMNATSLRFSIGGLLNRRVYTVPCQRDVKIDEKLVEVIKDIYLECLNLQGVVLTLPEYRLSFRLLAYDKILKEERSLGLKMLEVENWLRKHSRDVLDESDELLSVKYQLVYTVGKQVSLDGEDLRWKVCQDVLQFVKKIGKEMYQKYGTTVVEFEEESCSRFGNFRLLNNDFLEEFVGEVGDLFLESLGMAGNKAVKAFLVDNEMREQDHYQVINQISTECSTEKLKKILLVSGYLRRGVLGVAVSKRWRVEYGVSIKQRFRRMAVPFRAKDVAAEKTEFGHPDLAIILTHLSYYYSGLTDSQLEEAMEVLKNKEDAAAVYSSWISPSVDVEPKFRNYHSLNMKDDGQKGKLFQMLRKRVQVINYWLSNRVFPRESKQFPGKLVMTAWDLCYERQQNPVTGFSGTDDSSVLLPPQISQQNIKTLENTNKERLEILLRKENSCHRGFEMGVTCEGILTAMKEDGGNVLVDSGAIMLECSNEQVANIWLKINEYIEAAVYFNKNGELIVKCRSHSDVPFDVSPYQGNLEKCGIFLDDEHTRGTDFRFPVGFKACVTVGSGMKQDKLIQACWRMRMLGSGHSVTFYLSHDAREKVVDTGNGDGLTTADILKWVAENTKSFNQDKMLFWALAGRNYAQRLAAEENFHFEGESTAEVEEAVKSNADILACQCVDEEILSLDNMYGKYAEMKELCTLIPEWFAMTKRKLVAKNGKPLATNVTEKFDSICAQVLGRCEEHCPDKLVFSSTTEEEQEKELELEKEIEVEDQRVIVRPREFKKMEHKLHESVKNLILYGGPFMEMAGVVPLPNIFMSTTFWREVEPEKWGGRVFATQDFVSVVETGFIYKTDSHLRPINYLVSWASSGRMQVLVLSPFEVNELIPYFRNGQTKCTLHMFSARGREERDLLLNKTRLQLPVNRNGNMFATLDTLSLFLASGSLYFETEEEKECFAKFVKFKGQEKDDKEMEENGGFTTNKSSLVKKILYCRHATVSDVTHVMRLLNGRSIHFM